MLVLVSGLNNDLCLSRRRAVNRFNWTYQNKRLKQSQTKNTSTTHKKKIEENVLGLHS